MNESEIPQWDWPFIAVCIIILLIIGFGLAAGSKNSSQELKESSPQLKDYFNDLKDLIFGLIKWVAIGIGIFFLWAIDVFEIIRPFANYILGTCAFLLISWISIQLGIIKPIFEKVSEIEAKVENIEADIEEIKDSLRSLESEKNTEDRFEDSDWS